MRITGGKARGIPLSAPKGNHTRPATDRMREALFSSLGPRIEDARIADLFAGTGAYGLEAMSRGAANGLFVENNREVLACLQNNLAAVAKSCGSSLDDWPVLTQKIEAIPPNLGPFDIVFMDPPYAIIEKDVPKLFSEHIARLLAEDATLCFEMPGNIKLELPGWKATRHLGKAGKDKPTMVFYQRSL